MSPPEDADPSPADGTAGRAAEDPVGGPAERAPASARFRLKWAWWYVFPILLVLWFLGSGREREKKSAADLLAQSLADAQAHRYSECLASANQAIQADSSVAEAHNNAGWCAANLGRWEEGIRQEREALSLRPDMELAKNNLAWMEQQKANANARPSAAPIATTPPGAKPATTAADAALLMSLQHAQAHRFLECMVAAREATLLNTESAEAYNNLGYCAASMGKLDEGIIALNQALRLRPDFPLARNHLAWALSEKAKAQGTAGT